MTKEEIIGVMKEAGFYIGKDDDFDPAWERFAAIVAAAEREACAKVCDGIERRKWEIVTQGGKLEGLSPRDCAAAIRARS